MNIKQTLANGPMALSDLEALFGVGVSDDLDKLAAAGEVVRTVKGNWLHAGFLRRGEKVLLPQGVIARVDSVEGASVRVVPEIYPFKNQIAEFNPMKWKIAAVRMVLADELDLSKPGRYVVTLPGYPSMSAEAETALKALTNIIAQLMQASSNKKIVFHDEWFGEPQFGNLINKMRPNLERYVTPAPEAGHEGLEPKKVEPEVPGAKPDTLFPPTPEEQTQDLGRDMSGIMEGMEKEKIRQDISDMAADKIVQRLVGGSFIDWTVRHHAVSDICRALNVTLREAARSLGKDTIRDSDKRALVARYLMTLGDKWSDDFEIDAKIAEKSDLVDLTDEELGRFIVRQDQLRGIRPVGSTAEKMGCLWSLCARADRKSVESYAWRVVRGNLQKRSGLQVTEVPLVFTFWFREAENRPKVLKISYEEAIGPKKVLTSENINLGAAAQVLSEVFGDWAEEAVLVNPKLSDLTKQALIGTFAVEQDPDVCFKCSSPRINGGPDCRRCGEPTDVCGACGFSQHSCKMVGPEAG